MFTTLLTIFPVPECFQLHLTEANGGNFPNFTICIICIIVLLPSVMYINEFIYVYNRHCNDIKLYLKAQWCFELNASMSMLTC